MDEGPLLFMTCLIFAPLLAHLQIDDYVELLPALFAAFYIPFTGMIGTGAALT